MTETDKNKYCRKHIGRVFTSNEGYSIEVVDGGSNLNSVEFLFTELENGNFIVRSDYKVVYSDVSIEALAAQAYTQVMAHSERILSTLSRESLKHQVASLVNDDFASLFMDNLQFSGFNDEDDLAGEFSRIFSNYGMSSHLSESVVYSIVESVVSDDVVSRDYYDNCWKTAVSKVEEETTIYTAPEKAPCHSCQGGGCPSCQGYGFILGLNVKGKLKLIDGSPYILYGDREVEVYMPDLPKKRLLSV